jgi:hypothetical protein
LLCSPTYARRWLCPPSKAKLNAWRDAGADPQEKPRTFFRLTAVFDRSQVQELPPPAAPAPLDPPIAAEIDGDELALWLEPLTALAAEIGSTVAFEPIASGADGFYGSRRRRSSSRRRIPPNRQVKTLCMSWRMRSCAPTARTTTPCSTRPPTEELVAETMAYSVCSSSGVDPGEFSISYLAGWSERTPIATIERTAALIDRLSRRIEDAVANVNPAQSDDVAAPHALTAR